MTAEERVNAIAKFGFAERQARFLVTVMLFGGVCVPKQYARFAGTAYGQKVNAFFARLVERGFVTMGRCIHNRASLYHVHHRPLYEAIGEGRSRYRRPVPTGRAIERVMRLDSVLSYPDIRWFVNAQEKVDFVTRTVPAFPAECMPYAKIGSRMCLFPDDVALGVDASDRPVFLHLVISPFDDDFRAVLQRYGDLLGALRQWTLQLLFPKVMATAMGRSQSTFRDELAAPFSPTTLDEVRWYFEQLRRAVTNRTRLPFDARFRRAQYAFAAPRFRVLYRRWLVGGERAFDVVSTLRVIDHLANETGRVECRVLPLSYRHLSPLVSPSRSVMKGVDEGAREGATWSARSQPPPPEPELSISERLARDWHRLNESYNEQKTLGVRP